MRDKDLQNFRYLLGQLIRAERVPRRQVEGRLGVGHKNLEKLLDGTMEVRLRHILAAGEWLGVPPARLVELGCPETTRAAHRDVLDVLAPGRQAIEDAVARPRPASGEGGGDLEALIEKVLRRELERLGIGRREEPPSGGGVAE